MSNVTNILFNNNFLNTFCNFLINNSKNNNIVLSNYTIFVNNINLSKPLQLSLYNNIKQQNNVKGAFLPRIVSLSNLFEYINYNIIQYPTLYNEYKTKLHYPVVSKLDRSFILSMLIRKQKPALSLHNSLQMADYLGELIDNASFEAVNLQQLEGIVESQLAEHWQQTIEFLNIVISAWPSYLEQNNLIDESHKQNELYKICNAFLQHKLQLNDFTSPIYALNILTNNPQVSNLLTTINKLPHSKLIYYGINVELYNKIISSKKINYLHPQAPLQHTLLSIKATDIVTETLNSSYNNFIDYLWNKNIYSEYTLTEVQNIANNISLLSAKDTQEEAQVVSLAIRKALEEDNITIGLVVNDFSLIEKIKHELTRYNITIENKLGESLLKQPQCEFILLTLQLVSNNFHPINLLALLKHNYFNNSNFNFNFNNMLYFISSNIAHKVQFNHTLEDYINICKENTENNYYLSEHKNLLELFLYLQNIFAELVGYLKNNNGYNLQELLRLTVNIIEQLYIKNKNGSLLWQENSGKEFFKIINNLQESVNNINNNFVNNNNVVNNLQDYINILQYKFAQQSVYSTENINSRVFLYGKQQFNLINHNLIIMCGLDNSIPSTNSFNPWINKNIATEIGFIDQNYNIAMQNYLFCQALASTKILLTYSNKNNEGDAKFASSWIMQIENFFLFYKNKFNLNNINNFNLYKYEHFKQLAAKLNSYNHKVKTYNNIYRTVVVPQSLMPIEISATNLELLNNNPYSFFIKKILKISPLQDILATDDFKDFGIRMHFILETFFKNNSYLQLPLNEQKHIILNIAYHQFKQSLQNNIFTLFTWSAIVNNLHKIITNNNNNSKIFVEEQGKANITINNINVSITAKFDRVDIIDNSATIFDYKTSNQAVYKSWFLQLPIISWIILQGGFIKLPKINSVNANYLFINKNYNKNIQTISLLETLIKRKVLEKNTLINSHSYNNYTNNFSTIISNILLPYYTNNNIEFTYNVKSVDTSAEHKYFSRFLEWNTVEDILEEENTNITEEDTLNNT